MPPTSPKPSAAQIFAAFLRKNHGDLPQAFDALLTKHPEHADELRRLLRADQAATESHSVFGCVRQPAGESRYTNGARVGDVIGDYQLLRRIASGGQGEVWEAQQRSLGRRVALKLVLPDRINERTLTLFAREARAGGRLKHPGIVSVYDYGIDGGRHWISQELIEGGWTLRDFIDEIRNAEELPKNYYKAVARFVAEIADALQAAHDQSVIHRDVKPQNILITPSEHPKLTDFGLARITDEAALSMSGDIAGTWLYMSPEQVTAKRISLDHRTDLFSLGVVMYEMLALQRPFDGDTTHQIAENIIYVEAPDLRKIRSRVPRDLVVICGKAMEKRKDARYASAAELAADIRCHLANKPILAQPPTPRERAIKWVQRHPTRSLAMAGVSLAFMIISWLGIGLARSNKALQIKTIEADAKAAEAARKTRDVLRLSLSEDHANLMHEVDAMMPPHPQQIGAYMDWIKRAEALLAQLPALIAKRDELRAQALEPSAEERRAQRESHPHYERFLQVQAQRSSMALAQAVRSGQRQVKLPQPNWQDYPTSVKGLLAQARPMVRPRRLLFGQEALGLALALRAQKLAKGPEQGPVSNCLALAYYALGQDQAALEMAMAAAGIESKGEAAATSQKLQRRIEAAMSEDGRQAAAEQRAALDTEWERLNLELDERRLWTFPSQQNAEDQTRWWHGQLSGLINDLRSLTQGPGAMLVRPGAQQQGGA